MIVERFAPSPTGPLHLGHAYSAWRGWSAARAAGGRFLLRFEDLDASRVRDAYYQLIEEDLAWLGLDWDGTPLRQSERVHAYAAALSQLKRLGLVYACTCTRKDIQAAASAPQEGADPTYGPDGLVYPGTCRAAGHPDSGQHALRLDMRKTVAMIEQHGPINRLTIHEIGQGPNGETGTIALSAQSLIEDVGDIVLTRRDGAIAYHLAVIVDDAHQGVTHVTRGEDLFTATPIHRLLQAVLGLPTPTYRHHKLIRDQDGKRLAKRDDARAISSFREDGLSPEQVWAMIGLNDPRA